MGGPQRALIEALAEVGAARHEDPSANGSASGPA